MTPPSRLRGARSGLALTAIARAHRQRSCTYPGQGDYQGLLRESDLSEEAFARAPMR